MPLTHLADPRPHHLPHQAPTTNITIGEDTYTVLGKQLQYALLLSYLICETMEPQKCRCQQRPVMTILTFSFDILF